MDPARDAVRDARGRGGVTPARPAVAGVPYAALSRRCRGVYYTGGGRYLVERDTRTRPCRCHAADEGHFVREAGWQIWDRHANAWAVGTGPLHFRTLRDVRAWVTREAVALGG